MRAQNCRDNLLRTQFGLTTFGFARVIDDSLTIGLFRKLRNQTETKVKSTFAGPEPLARALPVSSAA